MPSTPVVCVVTPLFKLIPRLARTIIEELFTPPVLALPRNASHRQVSEWVSEVDFPQGINATGVYASTSVSGIHYRTSASVTWNVSVSSLAHCVETKVVLEPMTSLPPSFDEGAALKAEAADIGLMLVLVMWTNVTAETPCIPTGSDATGTNVLTECVRLIRSLPLVWEKRMDGSVVVSASITSDGSVDHYGFIVGPINADAGTVYASPWNCCCACEFTTVLSSLTDCIPRCLG